MSNVMKLFLSVAVLAVTAASASAATQYKRHGDLATLRAAPAASAFNLASRGLMETGAIRIQSRGEIEGDVGQPFSRN